MYSYEVTLLIRLNGNATYVKTIIRAGSTFQAQQLALSQAGPNGEIVFGPYPIDEQM